jgi:hypothetical protein
MINIFNSWKESLSIFGWKKGKSFAIQTYSVGICGLSLFFKTFGLVVITEILFFLIFRQTLISFFESLQSQNMNVALWPGIVRFVYGILWFIINTSILLAIRKRTARAQKGYFLQGIVHYVLLSLFGSFLLFFLIAVVLSFGLTVFPKFHSVFFVIWGVMSLVTVFFWLDLKFKLRIFFTNEEESPIVLYFKNMFRYFKDALVAFEHAVNLIMYNLPFFVIVVLLGILLNKAFDNLLFGPKPIFLFEENVFLFKLVKFPPEKSQSISLAVHVIAKYGKLFINYMWLCIIFVFYVQRKNTTYAKSLFK